MAGIKRASVSTTFNGQSDIVLFDAPTGGYGDDTTFANVTANGLSLGQVVADSTSWDGEEPSVETIKDEQGDVIIASPTAGTYAFSCEIADLSVKMVKEILKATGVDSSQTAALTSTGLKGAANVVKITDLPIQTRPIAILNDEANRWILFPKAKIVGSLKLDGKLWRLRISATAEQINTASCGTMMMGEGAPNYVA